MNNEKRYEQFRRIFALLLGIAVLGTSLYFSKVGFAFNVQNQDIWWVGWVLALAVTSAQFMFNTKTDELDWTIIILGIVAYGYSIWSNIQGFYDLRGTSVDLLDWLNVSGGIFMDIFPEKAIAWGLGVIKAGDLFGNWLFAFTNPEKVTDSESNRQKQINKHFQNKAQNRSDNKSVAQFMNEHRKSNRFPPFEPENANWWEERG